MSSILLAGLNHRTATIDIRERFTLNSCGLDVVHGELRRLAAKSPALQEVVVISTCNRLEVYAAATDIEAGTGAIGEYLADLYGANPEDLGGLLYYAYDDEGNTTSKTEIATGDQILYTWDHRNRLTKIEFFNSSSVLQKSVAYAYDALNRRVSKSVDENGNNTIDRV